MAGIADIYFEANDFRYLSRFTTNALNSMYNENHLKIVNSRNIGGVFRELPTEEKVSYYYGNRRKAVKAVYKKRGYATISVRFEVGKKSKNGIIKDESFREFKYRCDRFFREVKSLIIEDNQMYKRKLCESTPTFYILSDTDCKNGGKYTYCEFFILVQISDLRNTLKMIEDWAGTCKAHSIFYHSDFYKYEEIMAVPQVACVINKTPILKNGSDRFLGRDSNPFISKYAYKR